MLELNIFVPARTATEAEDEDQDAGLKDGRRRRGPWAAGPRGVAGGGAKRQTLPCMTLCSSRCVDNGICFVCSSDLTKTLPPSPHPLPPENPYFANGKDLWLYLFIVLPSSLLVLFFMRRLRCDSKCALDRTRARTRARTRRERGRERERERVREKR